MVNVKDIIWESVIIVIGILIFTKVSLCFLALEEIRKEVKDFHSCWEVKNNIRCD